MLGEELVYGQQELLQVEGVFVVRIGFVGFVRQYLDDQPGGGLGAAGRQTLHTFLVHYFGVGQTQKHHLQKLAENSAEDRERHREREREVV